MRIDEAIKYLQKLKDEGETNIILATWERDAMDEVKNDEEWEFLCDQIDNEMDWSETHDKLIAIQSELVLGYFEEDEDED